MSVQVSGNCGGLNSIAKANAEAVLKHYWNSLPPMIPTKSECESLRATINGYASSLDGCTVRIVCSPCVGRDIGGMAGASGDLSHLNNYQLGGVDKGMASFSSTPAEEIARWEEEFNRKTESFAHFNGASSGLGYVTTDDTDFDAAYADVLKQNEKIIVRRGVAPKGRGIYIGEGKFKGIDNSSSSATGINPNNEQVDRYIDKVSSFAYGYINNPRDLGIELPKLFMTATRTDDFSGFDINAIWNKLPGDRTPEEQQALADYNEFVEQMCMKIKETAIQEKKKIVKDEIDMAFYADDTYHPGSDALSSTDGKILRDLTVLKDKSEMDGAQTILDNLSELNFDGSGFQAEIYYDPVKDRYILSCRGTDEAKDVVTDVGQILLGKSKQYENAAKLADAILKSGIPLEKINITGHSLGGGLATVVALKTGCKTITYNQAHLTKEQAENLQLSFENANVITSYTSTEEKLVAISEPVGASIRHTPVNPKALKNLWKDKGGTPILKLGQEIKVSDAGNHGIVDIRNAIINQNFNKQDRWSHLNSVQYEVQKQLSSNNLYKKETINILVQ